MTNLSRCIPVTMFLLAVAAADGALPEPPKQNDPWTPGSGSDIPEYVVNVARTLFQAGMADPRGGTYREVELTVRRGGKDRLRTHAWAFPEGYAVCWNGLVYAVQTLGAPADLDRDVRIIVGANPWNGRLPGPLQREPNPTSAAFWSDMELGQALAPASVSLLLRLGRIDLAEQLWRTPEGSDVFGNVRRHETDEGLWLATAAGAWFGTAYWRLVGAFGADDDQDAADVGESILQWQSRVPDAWRVPKAGAPLRVPDISFVSPVPALLADSRRRLRETKRPPLNFHPEGNGDARPAEFLAKPQTVRIAELIDHLEDVRGGKIAIPGPLMFSFDPIYSAIAKEGEAAVNALLDAYENDSRLTRTFDYSRPWSVAYTPVPVRDVVRQLLGGILADPARVQNSTAAELREWWRQYQSIDKAARSFEVLADDAAGPQRWVDSAEFLTMRSDVQMSDGLRMTTAEACDRKKPAPPMYGEALRPRKGPSVSDLLARRTATLVSASSDLACRMAIAAALWDAKNALPAVRTAAGLRSCRENNLFAVARLSLGDPGAAADWSAEIRARPRFPPLRVDELSPLWMFPDDPALQQTAEWLFTRPESTFSLASRPETVYSALLAVPAFRRAVATALNDTKVIGTATRSPEGLLSYRISNGGGGGTIPAPDPRQAPPGQERPLRVEDLVGWQLRSLAGAPTFDPDWAESDKDPIIITLAEFLKEHESELRALPAGLYDTPCPAAGIFIEQQ